MLKIIKQRDTGKTKELIQYVLDNGGVIVCKDPARLSAKATAYGLGLPFTISYHDYLTVTSDEKKELTYYIDDLDSFLAVVSQLHGKIEGFNLTVDGE